MGCCGQKRAEIISKPVIKFLGGNPLRVQGSATGKVYVFTHKGHAQPVDRRDAPAIASRPDMEIQW